MGAPSRLPHIATMPGLARAFRIWAGDASIAHLPDVPGADEGERHLLACLGGVAAALAGERVGAWPTPVNSWALAGPRPPEELMEAVREGLGRRVDPLAVLYDACISAANRRRLGTVFTPTPVVNHMIGLTGKYLDRAPAVIVDPGAGVGAFSIAAARRWPSSRVLAVDVNVVTLGLLGARVAFEIDADPRHAQALERIELILGDYLDELDRLYADALTGTVVVIGNPPYTRIQELPVEERPRIIAACNGISLVATLIWRCYSRPRRSPICAQPMCPAWYCLARSSTHRPAGVCDTHSGTRTARWRCNGGQLRLVLLLGARYKLQCL